MQTLYLHIGRGKTGTTSIQSYLSSHFRELLARGLHYVRADDGGMGFGHQNLAKSFIVKPPDFMLPAHEPESVRAAVRDEIERSTASAILLSSENFPLADRGALKLWLTAIPRALTVKVILFVRSQDELAESEFNQMVKLKRVTKSFDRYASEDLEDCCYDEVAARWESSFGAESLVGRVFDASAPCLLETFLSCIPNLDLTGLPPMTSQSESGALNRSVGYKQLRIFQLLNAVEVADREGLYRSLREELARQDLPALLMDSRQARIFRDRYAVSNRAFLRRHMNVDATDLGGRRFSDERRDEIRARITGLGLDSLVPASLGRHLDPGRDGEQ